MPIIGLTDRGAAFPRIGTLRKGAAKPNEKQPGADLKDHFRFESDDTGAARAFAAAYGDKPNNIRVMFYFAAAAENFETWQEHHSRGALKHRCDGRTCVLSLLPNGTYSHEAVPCPSIALKAQNPTIDKMHLCRPVGRLKVIIPELQRMAYVLVPTTSINDILELQANLEAAEALRGDLRGIPFILSRRPRKVSTPQQDGQRARREKWLLSIEPEPQWVQLQLASMQRHALPDGERLALPAAGASYADPDTGEIFLDDDEAEIDLQPAPPPTSSAPKTADEAEQRFYARYAEAIGGREWKAVQRFLRSQAPAPATVEGWIAAAEAVRDQVRTSVAEPTYSIEDDYNEIEAAQAA